MLVYTMLIIDINNEIFYFFSALFAKKNCINYTYKSKRKGELKNKLLI